MYSDETECSISGTVLLKPLHHQFLLFPNIAGVSHTYIPVGLQHSAELFPEMGSYLKVWKE